MPERIRVPDPFPFGKLGKRPHVDVIAIEQADQLPQVLISWQIAQVYKEAVALATHIPNAFNPLQPPEKRCFIALAEIADAGRHKLDIVARHVGRMPAPNAVKQCSRSVESGPIADNRFSECGDAMTYSVSPFGQLAPAGASRGQIISPT